MPTYEYTCKSCGHRFEVMQKMTDAALKKCDQCHKDMLQRSPGGGIGVSFKGSGFYETDYKTKEKGKKDSTDSSCCPCNKSKKDCSS